ncbi:MAG: hypothetical protein PQJ60_08125, partial [Spirochaetales bacterium]|nr:hypothetical protein [Spirochaetales bacterium]
FYSVRRPDENRLVFTMNPLLRGILVFIFLSLMLTYAINMTGEDFAQASAAGKVSTILMPLLFFLGSSYRYSLSFDKERESCTLRKGLIFLYRTQHFTFDDLTALDYRSYEYHRTEEGERLTRGIPRRSRADLGFYFNGKLVQLERNAPKKGVEALYLAFTVYFPRTVHHN